MTRTVMMVSLLLLPNWAFAAKPPAAKPQKNEAQIKAVKADIDKLRHEETAALKKIDDQFKASAGKDEKAEEREKHERARLEREEQEALQRIDERFEHIIHHMAPKEVHHQMEETLKTLKHIRETLASPGWDHLDYGGFRAAAAKSIHAAEHQLKRTLEHDTWEERKKAGEDIHTAHEDTMKALAYPAKAAPGGDASKIAATNKLLVEDLHVLDHTGHLLHAVDHEIKDYEHEKREQLKKRDEVKKKKHEEFHAKIENLGKQIAEEEHQKKDLEHKKDEAKKKVKEHYAAQIKAKENKLKDLEKK